MPYFLYKDFPQRTKREALVKTESRILMVDDQDANIRLLRRMLNSAGYANVTGTPDPQEVLAMWEQSQPDLILPDLHMPHLDGFEVLEILRTRIAEAGYVPVLLLPGDIQPSVKQKRAPRAPKTSCRGLSIPPK